MCKNTNNPCPGCTKHSPQQPQWMFLTEEEGRSAQRPAIPGRTVPLPRDLPRHNTAEVTQ